MNKVLFIFLFFGYSCFAQENNFRFTFHEKNTLKPKIDTINLAAFERIKSKGIQTVPQPFTTALSFDTIKEALELKTRLNNIRMDSIFKLLKNEYPLVLYEKDSCLFLNGIDTLLKFCSIHDLAGYNLEDYKEGYLIIDYIYWESWEYILFNPSTKNYKCIFDRPIFMNDSIIYASDNYYSEGEFELIGLKGDNLYFGFDTYNWEMLQCYRVNKIFYFSFRSNRLKETEYKYIKFTFEKLF